MRSIGSASGRSAGACCERRARSSRPSRRARRAKRCAGRSTGPGAAGRCVASPYRGYQVPEIQGGTRVVSPRFVATAHRAGLAVQVWTVDGESDAERLLELGCDALITDRPDVIVPIVRRANGSTPDSGERRAARAARKTSSIIAAVSLPVFVFWRLGW